jgi:two-component system sensor histidine kinase DesK
VVKHSEAKTCTITIEHKLKETVLTIHDDGVFKGGTDKLTEGHGLIGMKERLEFINGSLELLTHDGTTLIVTVPNDVKPME